MLFEQLNELDQLSGIFGVLAILIVFLLGCIVLHKAIKTKKKTFFYFFFTVLFTISPWYPSGFGYIFWLITGNIFEYKIYILLGTMLVPFAILFWLIIYMSMINPEKKKLVLIFYSAVSIFFYIYVFYFLFFAPRAPVMALIGIKRTLIDIEYKGFVLIYLAFLIITAVVTGLHFAINSMKSDNIGVKWQGRFLLLSFLFFGVGAIADAIFELTVVTLIVFRVLLLLSTFLFYVGFIMPKWLEKILKIE